jgi:hypothetical protein
MRPNTICFPSSKDLLIAMFNRAARRNDEKAEYREMISRRKVTRTQEGMLRFWRVGFAAPLFVRAGRAQIDVQASEHDFQGKADGAAVLLS